MSFLHSETSFRGEILEAASVRETCETKPISEIFCYVTSAYMSGEARKGRSETCAETQDFCADGFTSICIGQDVQVLRLNLLLILGMWERCEERISDKPHSLQSKEQGSQIHYNRYFGSATKL